MPATSFLAVCFPNMKHSYAIWTQKAFYGVTYIAADRLYEDYFEDFKKSIESIHIENF